MAFRATRKQSVKKSDASDTVTPMAPEEQGAAPAYSVEDLVGGGPKTPEPAPESTREEELPEQQQPPPAPQDSSSFQQSRPQSHQGGSFRRPYPSSGGGYRGGSRSGGGSRGGYGQPRRDFGYQARRDAPQPGAYSNGNGFTPDIDVPTETVRGVLDTMPEGHGFLRPKYTPSEKDVYISQSQIRRFLLRNGDMVEGQARAPKDNERYWGLLKVEKVNELPAEEMEKRPKFEDLVPVYPNMHLRLETGQQPISTRIIDLVAPIGFGQRGLIVSPPKAGKTTILKEIAAGISANYPNVHLMAALIGERPEEVTDISRSVKGEVFASNFDESPAEQTRIAEVALDRAKRLVEMGKDVVILLDSITRLARAYNLVVNPSGRTLSGGFDPAALYPAKRFLGAARCVELFAFAQVADTKEEPKKESKGENKVTRYTVGGSLTVIGTALMETGSRMDDLIYEEFKGTGNMELHLSRALQERRIFPAIDIEKSGTRHDELLIGEEPMKKVVTLRNMLSLLSDEERTMIFAEKLGKSKSNDEFLDSLSKGG